MYAHTKFLIKLLKNEPVHNCVEVGVFKGDNAFHLLGKLPIDRLVGVDPYVRYKKFVKSLHNQNGVVARANLKKVERDMLNRMQIFKGRFDHMRCFSDEASYVFRDKFFDFIFIDGNHNYHYVKKDIKCWLPKVKSGGILAGHDYIDRPKYGIIKAVKELLPDHEANLGAKVWWKRIE